MTNTLRLKLKAKIPLHCIDRHTAFKSGSKHEQINGGGINFDISVNDKDFEKIEAQKKIR